MCSDEFRNQIIRDVGDYKDQVAIIDYSCSSHGADKYYQAGYENYLKSLGIKD